MTRKLIVCCAILLVFAAVSFAVENKATTNCSEQHVTFDSRPAVYAEEHYTIPGGTPLTIHQTRGGVAVRGTDRSDTAVTFCKGAVSQALLEQVRANVSGGDISTTGPDQDQWASWFVIETPRQTSVTADSNNGPLSLTDLTGEVKVTAKNGPVSLNNITGSADARATNGPISFRGDGGNVTLTTTNGPIAISISGQRWNGTGLKASAQNGPLSLSISPNFESGVAIESGPHAPFSCSLPGCKGQTPSSDEGRRRLVIGSNPVIQVSTENGPISVGPRREKGSL